MTDARATVLNAISDVQPGRIVSADTLREPFTAAQLKSAEISGALRNACHEGYLHAVTVAIPELDVMYPVQVSMPSRHPAAKGRHVLLYRRTEKAVPAHVCGVAS